MPPQPTSQPALKQNALAFGGAYLHWKLRPRLCHELPPNPADYDLSPEEGQQVIDGCTRALEESAIEKATDWAKAHWRPSGT